MKLIDVYVDAFVNWISGGELINRDKISLVGLKPLYGRFLTHQWITKVWCIVGLPVHYDYNITQAIRMEMFRMCSGVRTVIHTYNIPAPVNVTSDLFRRYVARSASNYRKYEEVFNQLEEDEKLTGKSGYDSSGRRFYVSEATLNSIKDTYDSYMYVTEQGQSGNNFVNTYYFIQASARTKKEMQNYTKKLEGMLGAEGIYFFSVKGDIRRYLSNFAPASYHQEADRVFRPMLLSPENQVGLYPTKTKGLIGGSGIMLGVDWQTKLPLMVDFFSSGAAQVIMMLGMSGCGKTFTAFSIALELLAKSIHCSVIDIKGGEWDRLAQFAEAKVVDMGAENARFVNTLRLDDFEGVTKEEASELYNTAVSGTVSLLSIMTNLQEREGNVTDLEMILEQAVTKTYIQCGVTPQNPSSFSRTATMRYTDVLTVVEELTATKSYTEQQQKMCSLIRTRCSSYLLGEGRYGDAFRNELTIKEVMDTPLIIYSFNKNSGTMLDTLDTIRVFMVQFMDGKKHTFRKRQKLHTAAFYEELQRCDQFGKLVETISHRVTGSRSSNLIIFLLLNAVSTFDNSALAAIKSNITTQIVGKVIQDDIPILIEKFGCAGIKNYLEFINDKASNSYRNCFAIQYDTGADSDKTIFKTVLPDSMVEVFKTRDFNEKK